MDVKLLEVLYQLATLNKEKDEEKYINIYFGYANFYNGTKPCSS